MKNDQTGIIIEVNGPVVKGAHCEQAFIGEQVIVGNLKLPGEVIRSSIDSTVIQAYEDTSGLTIGEPIVLTGHPLSVELGPGLVGSIFDGLQRPLASMAEDNSFIERGRSDCALSREKKWHFVPAYKNGDAVKGYDVIGTVKETEAFTHKILVPHECTGTLTFIAFEGDYNIEDKIADIQTAQGSIPVLLYSQHPVRTARASLGYAKPDALLLTGQRVLDFFFPLAKGGSAIIPGGFGAGKTITQHQLAKWSDADIIIYIGCGERGNEMVQVLEEFPSLIDPRTGRPLMERTVLIANTSNMPVTAREASIYTGIAIAEYFRDMGYDVALMADSTSRWAEALREISGRLEELPIEEGYPSYLAHRLAEFYERAGKRKITNERNGSISVIGAISPPGGDFSEPVTVHSKRYTKTFWALDKDLASSRHFPSINWMQSYSAYLDTAQLHWSTIPDGNKWKSLRQEAVNLLAQDDNLQKVVKLIGPDALPEQQKLVLFTGSLIKEGFLQQLAFDEIDSYCPPQKQLRLMQTILLFHKRGLAALENKITASVISELPVIVDILRARMTIANNRVELFDELYVQINNAFDALEKSHE